MMRRSRISVRPNVRPGGRGPVSSVDEGKSAAEDTGQATPLPTASPLQPATEKSEETTALTSALETPLKKSSDKLEKTGQNGETSGSGSPPASSLQRRKRFSAMPNLAKPRVAPAPPRSAANVPGSVGSVTTKLPFDTEALTPQSVDKVQAYSGAPHGLRSPGRPTTFARGRQSKAQEKPGPTLSPVCGTAPEGVASSQAEMNDRTTALHSSQSAMTQQTVPSNKPATQVPSLVQVKASQDSTSSEKVLPSTSTEALKGLHVSSDRLKILKARRLKELMKQEMKKERPKRRKPQICEFQSPLDPNKMTMRDLIYYLPPNNPMKTQLVNNCTENGTTAAPRDEFPERIEKVAEEDDDYVEDEEEQLMVPRVKVAEDGSLIIDEDSLTVEVQRSRGPAIVEGTDPIFERGSTTTYSSFRTLKHTKHWSNKETDMFFLAISMVGTDFSMIGQLFPHRARTEIKNKFKKEERVNSWRIDKAFREKQPYDQEFFSMLLEKVLAADKRKRNKPRQRCSVKKPRRKRKVEKKDNESPETAEDKVDSSVVDGDLETAEKENEDSSNVLEPENNTSTTHNRNKRKAEKETKEVSQKKPKERKRKKRTKKSIDEDVVAIFGDSEDDVNDGQSATDQAMGSTESAAEEKGKGKEETMLKLPQSRGCLQKPLPNVGKRRAKRTSESLEKRKDNGCTQNEVCNDDGIMVEEESTDSQQRKAKKIRRVMSSDEECTAENLEEQQDTSRVQEGMLNKPTRSGRIPQLSQKLKQAEDDEPAVSPPPKETSPEQHSKTQTGKPKPSLAATQRKVHMDKSKPVGVQLSSPDVCKDDHDSEEEDGLHPTSPQEQNQLPVSVGLCSAEPLPTAMEETMEENMIGTLFPEQLDGLAENTETVSEAARTLLSTSDSELPQSEEAQNTGNFSVTMDFPSRALLEMEPESSLWGHQRNQALSSAGAPKCVTFSIPDLEPLEPEPVEEMDLTEAITASTELPEEPAETATSVRESFSESLSLDSSVQSIPQGLSLLNKSTDLPTTCNSYPSPDVGSQKPAEEMKIKLDNIQGITTEEREETSDKQNLTADELKEGEVSMDTEKGSDIPVKATCQRRRQFPRPNLSRTVRRQAVSPAENSDPPFTTTSAAAGPVGTVTQVPVEEEKQIDIVQVIKPEHSEIEDKQSLAQDETSREAGAPEEMGCLATSVHNVLSRGLPTLRPTVEVCALPGPAAAVDATREKPVKDVQHDCKSIIKETMSEKNEAEESSKQSPDVQKVEDCSDSAVAPSKPILQGRRSRFPKPRPNLGKTSRTPSAVLAQSIDKVCANTNEDNLGDLKTATPVDSNSIPGIGILEEETEKSSDVVGISIEEPKISSEPPSEGQNTDANEPVQVPQAEQALEERLTATPMEPGFFSANVASNLPVEAENCTNTAQVTEEMPVTTDYMESEPTFVLTLFPVPDEQFLPPLETMEPQSELLMTKSEPQSPSSKLLLDSTVEPWTGGSEVSNMRVSDHFVPPNGAQESDIKQVQDPEQRNVPDQNKEDPQDLSVAEPHGSRALLMAESRAPTVTGTARDTSEKTQTPSSPPKGKKKLPPRNRRAKPNIRGKESKPTKEDQAKFEKDAEQLAASSPSSPSLQCGAAPPAGEVVFKGETTAVLSSSKPAEDTGGQLEPLPKDIKAEDSAEGGIGGEKPSLGSLSPPQSLKAPLTRSGRKPRGFLSFVSSGGTSETASPLGSRALSRKPNINTSLPRRNRISTKPRNTHSPSTTAKDSSPLMNTAEVPSTSETGQGEFLCVKNVSTDEEPSNVSEFFFSDIFTEVDDPV